MKDSIWQHRLFVRLFASYGISMLGRWFDYTAMMVLFGYVWQAEPLLIAMIPVAYALPHALLSQFAGILADRFNKIKLMCIADLLTAVLTLVLILAPNVWIALIILVSRATLTVIHFPAQQAAVKHFVPKQWVGRAVTLNGAVNELSKIIGPILGGVFAASFSPQFSMFINAIAYGVSSLIVVTMIKHEPKSGYNKAQYYSFWYAWKSSWGILQHNQRLKISMLLALLGMSAIQMSDAQITVLLRMTLPERADLIGWIMAASGAGALISMLIIDRLNKIDRYREFFWISFFLMGMGFGGLRFSTGVIFFLTLAFITGLGVGIFTVTIAYMLQRESTEQNIGRLSGLFNSLSNFVVLLAPIAGGLMVRWTNIFTIFMIVAGLLLLLSITSALVCYLVPTFQEEKQAIE
ncbi:MFS transporter [Amphibacillus cookii]|uniref:MFS transporter n=1 Tax=Amphibacillus cookii TaxID=767787 RepID=UPI0019565937|nr:MFS transporter [Amphibacillus cookii]MBM7542925.1 MFS family permease [Amphibacillus cookii]